MKESPALGTVLQTVTVNVLAGSPVPTAAVVLDGQTYAMERLSVSVERDPDTKDVVGIKIDAGGTIEPAEVKQRKAYEATLDRVRGEFGS